jgi:hypothetical protein
MTTPPTATVRSDPYDVDTDDDPYPTWHRLPDESPLYRNPELDFYALLRWDDVKPDAPHVGGRTALVMMADMNPANRRSIVRRRPHDRS